MHRELLTVGLSALALSAGYVRAAAPWIELLDEGFYVTDLSYDGTAAAGNVVGDGTYETFRWTASTGFVRLGQASVPTLGVGGGSPDISYNGDLISASIADSNYNYLTLGRWSLATGLWDEAFVPQPSFVREVDSAVGSAWGLTGDGQRVVGYYYLQLPSNYRVQPCAWGPSGSLEDLPASRGRANAASYDGSVVGGWEDSGLGPWFPTIWRNGVKYWVADALGSTQVNSLNLDGSIGVGDGPDEYQGMKVAAIFRWNGNEYDWQPVGALDGTVYGQGGSRFTSVSDDGTIAVGSNNWGFNPLVGGDAIIWTPTTGLMSGTSYVESLGLNVPSDMELRDFQCVSPDGSTIAAVGLRTDTFQWQTFLIHLRAPCAADFNNDRMVDDTDFVAFSTAYDLLDCADPSMPLRCPSDINRDGLVDDTDFVLFAGAYDALLCD